jgi:methionyl-tRNA synthetase
MPPDYSEEQLGVTYRILADQIGNLVARISSPSLLRKVKRFDNGDQDPELDEALSTMRNEFGSRMEAYQITRACEGVIEVIMAVSGHLHLCPRSNSCPFRSDL